MEGNEANRKVHGLDLHFFAMSAFLIETGSWFERTGASSLKALPCIFSENLGTTLKPAFYNRPLYVRSRISKCTLKFIHIVI